MSENSSEYLYCSRAGSFYIPCEVLESRIVGDHMSPLGYRKEYKIKFFDPIFEAEEMKWTHQDYVKLN